MEKVNACYFDICVRDNHRNVIESFHWDRMTFKQRNKWDWYFHYRAALLRTKYPKLNHDVTWGTYEVEDKQTQIRREGKKIKTRT